MGESEQLITVNVGGVYFVTRRSTLEDSDSFFSGAISLHPDCKELFVDRDPTYFRHILNWMRGVRYLPEDENILQELSWEADYYSLTQLQKALMRKKSKWSIARSLDAINGELRQMNQCSQ